MIRKEGAFSPEVGQPVLDRNAVVGAAVVKLEAGPLPQA